MYVFFGNTGILRYNKFQTKVVSILHNKNNFKV